MIYDIDKRCYIIVDCNNFEDEGASARRPKAREVPEGRCLGAGRSALLIGLAGVACREASEPVRLARLPEARVPVESGYRLPPGVQDIQNVSRKVFAVRSYFALKSATLPS